MEMMLMKIISPGKIASHGYFVKCSCALLSRFPHEGVGGWMPNPKKLKPDSSMMAYPNSSVASTMIGPITVEATLEFGYAIIEESGLSFLGFGIQPPTPSWGNLLSNAQEHFTKYPWLAIFPGLMIFLSIISINYIGDGLRDAFDPYKVLDKVGEV